MNPKSFDAQREYALKFPFRNLTQLDDPKFIKSFGRFGVTVHVRIIVCLGGTKTINDTLPFGKRTYWSCQIWFENKDGQDIPAKDWTQAMTDLSADLIGESRISNGIDLKILIGEKSVYGLAPLTDDQRMRMKR